MTALLLTRVHTNTAAHPLRKALRRYCRAFRDQNWLEGLRLNLLGGSYRENIAYLRSLNNRK